MPSIDSWYGYPVTEFANLITDIFVILSQQTRRENRKGREPGNPISTPSFNPSPRPPTMLIRVSILFHPFCYHPCGNDACRSHRRPQV